MNWPHVVGVSLGVILYLMAGWSLYSVYEERIGPSPWGAPHIVFMVLFWPFFWVVTPEKRPRE
jgi:hypothetical protein